MIITLQRTDVRDDGVFGMLLDQRGNFICCTLEHAYKDNIPKVIEGTYECVRGMHRLKSFFDKDGKQIRPDFETFMVSKVPNRVNILFHVGNYEEDSDGCVLLGSAIGWKLDKKGKMLMASGKAFENFMALLSGLDTFTLIVKD